MAYGKSSPIELRRNAREIFQAALAGAKAERAVRSHVSVTQGCLCAGTIRLPVESFDRILLISAGKASIEMAAAVEEILGPRLSGGVVVSKHASHSHALRVAQLIEAEHPIPGEAGVRAALAVRELLAQLNARDLVIVAVSGGASALLPAPAPPVTLQAKQRTTELLLRAGANIGELNAVRKHLSMLKGGRLAALAYPATVLALLLSDVIGDGLDVIGSGLTAPDDSTFQDALAVLQKFELMDKVPLPVRERLEAGARGAIEETPKPGDPIFENVHHVIVGNNRLALESAARKAEELGFAPLILSSTIEGEARDIAQKHAQILRGLATSGSSAGPACILSGGETTVMVRGGGVGGRNQEFALAAALAIDGVPDVLLLSAGTDGTDGPTDAAGALATGDTVERAGSLGLDAGAYLADNNSYPFFDALGDLIRTGPTGTNVMDIHVLLAARVRRR